MIMIMIMIKKRMLPAGLKRCFGALILLLAIAGCQGKTEKSAEPAPEQGGSRAEVPVPIGTPFEPLAPPTPEEIEAGWIQLFDGETLFGWEANDRGQENPVNWHVEDGVITADSTGQSLLLTYVPFADYELRLEYRLAAEGNSGVFLRTVPNPTDPAVDCYELNFCENHESHPTGSLVKRHVADPRPLVSDNQWIPVHVTVDGPTIKATIGEDADVLDFTDTSEHILKSGRIGLQKNEGKIEFRNVALKPLGSAPIFNGKDLSGWRVVPGSESKFEVKNGTIHVTNGLGFLETEQTFDDFLLQAQALTKGEGLNSGIFFRGLSGEEGQSINGYEMQIQHQQSPIDAKEFVGDRTGGIFRLADPRKVVSKDNEWCQLTLVAAGPRFATWVNGVPVVAWEDAREPDENPRRGLRLKAGHISLQGHDETTDLEFKNLKLAPLPKSE